MDELNTDDVQVDLTVQFGFNTNIVKREENVDLNPNQNEGNILNNELTTLARMEQSAVKEYEEITANNYIEHPPLAKLEQIIEAIKGGEDNCQSTDSESLVDLQIKHEQFVENQTIQHLTIQKDLQSKKKRKGCSKVILNCNFCGKYSGSKSEHVNHLRVHQIRTKNFRQIRMLKKLRDDVADGTICFKKQLSVDLSKSAFQTNYRKIFTCMFCIMYFNDMSHLKRHIKVHFKSKKTYPCSICSITFTQKQHYRTHVNGHKRNNAKKRYKCKICHAYFQHKMLWEKHMVSHNVKFKCSQCNKKYTTSHSLKKHKQLHSGILYRCELCHKDFLSDVYLSLHMKRHNRKPEDRKYECHVCSKKFFDKAAVTLHMRTHLKPTYKCHICPKVLTTKAYLEMHIQNHEGAKNFKCLKCNHLFISQHRLNKHQAVVHRSEQLFKCNYCPRSYSEKTPLRKHIKQHTGEEIYKCLRCGQHYMSAHNLKKHSDVCKPFECPVCSKKFNQQSQMKVHLLRHDGQRNFQCQICDKKFLLRCDLKQHLIIHTDMKPYKCKKCSKTFNVKNNMQVHMKLHENKKVPCTVCSKLFSKGSLKKHMKLHTDDRKFKCTVCPKTFIQKTHLEYHLANHTGEKNFQCPDCPKAFVTIHKLKRHQQSHENSKKVIESKSKNWTKKFECPDCPKIYSHSYKLKRHMAWDHVKI